MTGTESTRAELDELLTQLRELVKKVAAESDPGKIHMLFAQIRSLLRAQLANSERRIMWVGNRRRA